MRDWSETQIGFVYYSGILLSIIMAVVVLLILRPKLQTGLVALVGKEQALFWGRVFRLTLLAIALVGALSVTFHGCRIDQYDHLLNSPYMTFRRGITQVARSSVFLARAIAGWLLAWLIYFCLYPKTKPDKPIASK